MSNESKKALLNEATTKRFWKLAGLRPIHEKAYVFEDDAEPDDEEREDNAETAPDDEEAKRQQAIEDEEEFRKLNPSPPEPQTPMPAGAGTVKIGDQDVQYHPEDVKVDEDGEEYIWGPNGEYVPLP